MAKTNRAAQGKAAAPAAAAPSPSAETPPATAVAGQPDPEQVKPLAQAPLEQEAAAAADEEAAAAAAQADDAPGDLTGKTIAVTSVSGNNRRRAGHAFAREAVELAVDELTEDELGAILADPQLRVRVV